MTFPFPLSPRAKKCGNGYIDICPAHDDREPSLSVSVTAEGKLLAKCFAGCEYKDILRAAGMLGNSQFWPISSGDEIEKAMREGIERKQSNVDRARLIWSETVPLENTLSQVYLNSRGLQIWGPFLRHHNRLFHSPTSEYRRALVAAVKRDGVITGIHRIFLDENGKKLDKMMLGDCKGGAVHLGGQGDTLIVSEGIENGLAFAQFENWGMGEYWAALSTSGLKSLKLPDSPSNLIVAADGDQAGTDAAFALISRAANEGWNARYLSPSPGKDWNDELLEAIAHAN